MAWMNLRVASSFIMCACGTDWAVDWAVGWMAGSDWAPPARASKLGGSGASGRGWAAGGWAHAGSIQSGGCARGTANGSLTTEVPAPSRIFSRAERSCRPTCVTPMGQAALPTDTPM